MQRIKETFPDESPHESHRPFTLCPGSCDRKDDLVMPEIEGGSFHLLPPFSAHPCSVPTIPEQHII